MKRNDLRERILDAAASVLREQGPRKRLITTIAERAQVSRPTLYRHFPERYDIYDSLLRLEIERVVGELATRASNSASPFEDYVNTVVDLVCQARSHQGLQAVIAGHPEIMAIQLPKILPITLEIAEPRLAPILEAGFLAGRWPSINPRVAITWTVRLVVSMILMPRPEDAFDEDLHQEVAALLHVATTISRTQVAQ